MAFYTQSGKKFGESSTEWLQNTRLMSEAVFRLYSEHKDTGRVQFSSLSWPKQQNVPSSNFEIDPVTLSERMHGLLKTSWRSQFIFLESIWEQYLQDVVLELRHKDASIFEPFCEKDFMASMVRDVLSGNLETIEEIKDEAAARFAAGITRKPWKEQWWQLSRLEVGLSKQDESQPWFPHLDVYFEMRNCIIHRQGRVSSLLNQKTDYYQKKSIEIIDIWPQHLDFNRKKFLECVGYIESKIEAKFSSQ